MPRKARGPVTVTTRSGREVSVDMGSIQRELEEAKRLLKAAGTEVYKAAMALEKAREIARHAKEHRDKIIVKFHDAAEMIKAANEG